MKITIIYPFDVFGDKIGGIETFIKNFIKYAPLDFDIELIGTTEDKNKRPVGKLMELEFNGKKFKNYPVIYVRNPNKRNLIPLNLKFTWAVFKHNINMEKRILEFHRIESALPFCFKDNKKILYTHTNIQSIYNSYSDVKWKKFPWLYFWLEKRIINKMEIIFVVCKKGIEFYRKIYPYLYNRFSFISTWADNEVFYPYPKKELKEEKKISFLSQYNLASDSKLILFVGRLELVKNPMLLLKTFKFIHSKDCSTKLIVIGDGAFKVIMEKDIQESGLNKEIIFLGSISQQEVANIMRISDVFLFTSAFEGGPISILESLASGLPVVSTDVGEVKRFIKKGSGITVKLSLVENLGNAVLKVLSQPDKFNKSNCLLAVKPYFAKTVLSEVYQHHYQLYNKNSKN